MRRSPVIERPRVSLLQCAPVIAALSFPAPAAAQVPPGDWYLGGGVGRSGARLNTDDFRIANPRASETRDEDGTGYKLFGGYRLAPHWAIELGVADLGRLSYAASAGAAGAFKLDYRLRALSSAGVVVLPFSERFGAQARFGVVHTTTTGSVASVSGPLGRALDAQGLGTGSSGRARRTGTYWGLAAQYDLAPGFGVRLDYDNFGRVGNASDSGRAKVDLWSINALVRF